MNNNPKLIQLLDEIEGVVKRIATDDETHTVIQSCLSNLSPKFSEAKQLLQEEDNDNDEATIGCKDMIVNFVDSETGKPLQQESERKSGYTREQMEECFSAGFRYCNVDTAPDFDVWIKTTQPQVQVTDEEIIKLFNDILHLPNTNSAEALCLTLKHMRENNLRQSS